MPGQENERSQLAEPSTAKSPQDGSVNVKRPARVDKRKNLYPRPSPQGRDARWLALCEQSRRAARTEGWTFEEFEKQCNKSTEVIRALENKYKELHATVEALQRELRGGSNSVDQI
ncbi:hypothetical protein FPRO04_05924 [Fusarium proliferatum]|nr:hypothetical protein FPRO03_01595 [Fusarium proliferatum]KAG4279383.1 hypothetical protein FPRO04_05924 [Fusarium proliferatum]